MRKCCANSDIVVTFFIDSNGKITANCVKYISFVCMGLQICCTQYIYETCFMQCFIGVRHTLIVLCEEMLHNFRRSYHVFCRFKWKDYNKLREIYFLSMHRAANMLHAIYLWNMFQVICFIGVRLTLGTYCMFIQNYKVMVNFWFL